MVEKQKWRTSVRELAEFVWQKGDLAVGGPGAGPSMRQGAEAHRWFQKKQGKGYSAEVFLSREIHRDGIALEVAGRADGVYEDLSPVVVEELKTTTESLMLLYAERRPVHLAQAKLYGAMLAMERNLEKVEVRLTYINIETMQTRSFSQCLWREELEEMFFQTVAEYEDWINKVLAWRKTRNASLEKLPFPFQAHRPGQSELIRGIGQNVSAGKHLFVEAPTGAGKTMAVLYGALWPLKRKETSQIVFATAKTVGRLSADKALDELEMTGARIKRANLGAKHRLCAEPDGRCTDSCPLIKGHYDRLKAARIAVMTDPSVDKNLIPDVAEQHDICPYWLVRELVPWVDVVVCDYNYLFDPRVSLHDFSRRGGKSVLVDEAHNLVDRAREMYGATLHMGSIERLRAELQPQHAAMLDRIKTLRTQIRLTVKETQKTEGPWPILKMPPPSLIRALEGFVELAGAWLLENRNAPFRESLETLFFESHAFIRTAARTSDSDITMVEGAGRALRVKILCLDPSARLREKLETMGAYAVFFSATLSPIAYFRRALGGDGNDVSMALPFPFPRDNLKTIVAKYVSTRYRDRDRTGEMVARIILTAAGSHDGNYLVYFPSYAYLNDVAKHLPPSSESLEFAFQTPGFSEDEKRDFLAGFTIRKKGSRVGLAVLGGLFGEGIDLLGERLEGVVVVSPGLPKIGVERELIRTHFEKAGENGFKHAYLYPGMNRVVQAAGRLIRSETDVGTLILVGDRFASSDYASLLPPHLAEPVHVSTKEALQEQLLRFWSMVR